jgi:hypothetical protein
MSTFISLSLNPASAWMGERHSTGAWGERTILATVSQRLGDCASATLGTSSANAMSNASLFISWTIARGRIHHL